MSGGTNGPAVQNAGAPLYDRAICYDSPVDYDSGLFSDPRAKTLAQLRSDLIKRLGFTAPLTGIPARTMASMKRSLMIRLGFAAQVNNYPPGMSDLLGEFLTRAQQLVYQKFESGFSGTYALQPFAADVDSTTMNPEGIFLQALADAKSHYEQDTKLVTEELGEWYRDQALRSPPGMTDILTQFLQDAQEQLYWKYDVLRTERFWTWQTVAGSQFYDIPVDCTKYLETRKISEIWCQDGTQWHPLDYGISPGLYTSDQQSRPARVEIREYLEVWPIPDVSTYLIRIKGRFGIKQFSADGDLPTIDAEPIFLHALARAKAHYGQKDAATYEGDLERLIARYVAGSHVTRRYIPGNREWIPPPRPVTVP